MWHNQDHDPKSNCNFFSVMNALSKMQCPCRTNCAIGKWFFYNLDAGHIAQNLALSAISLRLGSCQIGAFYDDELNQIVNIEGTQESAIYMSIVGHPQ